MIQFEYSSDENLLYVAMGDGPAAETIEVEESVSIDVAADGRPIGIEFLNADDFLPFLARNGGRLTLPEHVEEGGILAASS
ncbi:MAG: DUF2283 domain-containing protein [Thermomicrobiales bacterium]